MIDQTGAKPDPSGAPSVPTDPYAASKATLRDTLKWLATTFAAVVGVVMAGVSITGIGKLDGAGRTTALLEGGAGLMCIVIATGVMLYLLLPRNFYFGELLEYKNRKLLDRLNQHAVEILPAEFRTVNEFVERRDEAVALIRSHRNDPSSPLYTQGAKFLDDYYPDIVKLAYFAHYELMRTNVHRAQWLLLALGAMAITGLGLFAAQIGSAKNPNDVNGSKPPPPIVAHVTVDLPPFRVATGPTAPTVDQRTDDQHTEDQRIEDHSIGVLLNAVLDASAPATAAPNSATRAPNTIETPGTESHTTSTHGTGTHTTDTRITATHTSEPDKASALPRLLSLIQSLADAGAMPRETAKTLRDDLIKNSLDGGKEILVHVGKKIIDQLFPDDRPSASLVTVNIPPSGCAPSCSCGCALPRVKPKGTNPPPPPHRPPCTRTSDSLKVPKAN